MAGAAAGRVGAYGHIADTISVAPGHTISMQGVRKKLAALDGFSMPEVLSAAEGAWREVWEHREPVDAGYFGSDKIYGRYRAAQARKDWQESSRLILGARRLDSMEYRRLLDAEEAAHAFSVWLCGTALGTDRAYRWIDPPELESCMGGTFESKIEADGTRRGFKALTINPRLQFEGRKIQMRVPIDGSMHRNIQCVQYTILPRNIEEKDERVCDPKEAVHAAEAEVRVPDGTPIPPSADFVVLPDAGISRDAANALGTRYKIMWPGG